MSCAACPITVKKAIMKEVPGVVSATVDYESQSAIVSFDPSKASVEAISEVTAAPPLGPLRRGARAPRTASTFSSVSGWCAKRRSDALARRAAAGMRVKIVPRIKDTACSSRRVR